MRLVEQQGEEEEEGGEVNGGGEEREEEGEEQEEPEEPTTTATPPQVDNPVCNYRTLICLIQSDPAPVLRVSDPNPDWIRIQSDQWIRTRNRNPDPDPGGHKRPTEVEKN